MPCADGTYKNSTGADACDTCPEGYFCLNQDRADICTQGYFCPSGTGANLTACPIGSFGATTGLKIDTECSDCSRK